MRLTRLLAAPLALTVTSLVGCASPPRPVDAELLRLTAVAEGGRPPIQAFAAPRMGHVSLSPSGKYLAYEQHLDGATYLTTRALDGGERHVILKSDNERTFLSWFLWVSDERLLVGARYPALRGGVRTTETRLLGVDRDGKRLNGRLVEDHTGVWNHLPQQQDVVLGRVPNDRQHVLVALDIRTAHRPDVYKLNVDTGALELVQANVLGVRRWQLDQAGEVRLGVALDDTTARVVVRPPGSREWTTLHRVDVLEAPSISPLGFDEDPAVLYFLAPHEGREAIFKTRLTEPGMPRQLVEAHRDYDMGGILYHPWRKRVVGTWHVTDRTQSRYWDPEASELMARLRRAMPEGDTVTFGRSDDGARHVVVSSGVRQPPRVWLFDRANDRLNPLATRYPLLKPEQLVPTVPIAFTSRDGLALRGYLTLPAGRPLTGLPLVLFPHGGPATRDALEFDPWTQFLASRGWAVLQMNFRGSAGYGSAFMEAGFKRWGLEMQDDLADGVRAVVDRGVVDPRRVCVVGASYGGYAALMGLVRHPELYRCAVSLNGVSDLRDLLRDYSAYLGYSAGIERQLGGWWTDRERLRETSPITHAAKISAPVLLIHGAEDRIVPVEQSRDMAAALQRMGRHDARYVELPLGDHSLSRQEDLLRSFLEMERFLTRYLDDQ